MFAVVRGQRQGLPLRRSSADPASGFRNGWRLNDQQPKGCQSKNHFAI
jgi:hypothetical protein